MRDAAERYVVGLGAKGLPSPPGACRFPRPGQVAQLVEQRTENPRVGGSSPPLPSLWDHMQLWSFCVFLQFLNGAPLFVNLYLMRQSGDLLYHLGRKS